MREDVFTQNMHLFPSRSGSTYKEGAQDGVTPHTPSCPQLWDWLSHVQGCTSTQQCLSNMMLPFFSFRSSLT